MRKSTLFIVLMLASLGNLKAQHISNILDSTMAGIDTSFFYEESFIELDTSSYLTTSRLWDRAPYNLALDEFTGTSEASGRVTSSGAGYWQCVCEAERAFFEDEMSAEDFDQVIENCKQQYVGYTSKSSSANPRIKNVVESNHKMVLSSYPQPTSGRLTVVLSEPVLCLLSYQVSDVSGKILLKNSMLPDNQEMKLDVSRLPVGVYFLSISFNSGTEVVKFSKE